jgi:DNA polymerase-3 subunit epsilon
MRARKLRRAGVRALRQLRGQPHPFGPVDFVIVDVETTGWTPEEAAITEIGAVRVSGGQVCGQFSCLINPGQEIPASVAALTGIDEALVAAAPPLRTVLPVFLAFAGDCVLTAHNAPFDIGFLTAACRACGLPWPGYQVLDTAELARRVLGRHEVPDCKLATLATFFGATTRPVHRALPDALATADVLTGLLRLAAATGTRTLAEAGAGYAAAATGIAEAS